jgi:N utilization substance protein A
MLTIGYLIPFLVVKALPDYDSFLVTLIDKGVFAQLPKRYAFKDYKTGESGWAAVFGIKGSRIILSQKSPQYVRKILEFLLSSLIKEGKIKFKRVAKLANANFHKVAVAADDSENYSQRDVVKLCMPCFQDLKNYVSEKVIIVKYSEDMEEYIINSLSPAPMEHITKVILLKDTDEAIVYVEDKYAGYFFGPKGQNVSTASKLTGYKINIQPV